MDITASVKVSKQQKSINIKDVVNVCQQPALELLQSFRSLTSPFSWVLFSCLSFR